MSGTIIPGVTLTSQPVNRQTIPYGDRPMVTMRGNGGYATREFYQWSIRINQGVASTIDNVGTVIEVVNTVVVNLATIETEIAELQAAVAEIEQELTALPGAMPIAGPVVSSRGLGSPFPLPPPLIPLNGGSILLEQGSSSEKISQLPSAAPLDGTELYVAVQSGADAKVLGNEIGYVIYTFSWANSPLNAAVGSGNPGTGAALVGGNGDTNGNGGQIQIIGGGGAGNGQGGAASVAGGNGGPGGGAGGDLLLSGGSPNGAATNANGGNVFLAPQPGKGTGTNGNLVAQNTPTADPAETDAVWDDNGAIVKSGNPVNAVASLVSGSAVSLASGTAKDVITVTVGNAGNYWLLGVVYFTGAAGTTVTSVAGSVGTATNTLDLTVGRFGTLYLAGAAFSAIGQDISVAIIGVKVAATAGETFRLCAKATFGVSTLSAYGEIAIIPIL